MARYRGLPRNPLRAVARAQRIEAARSTRFGVRFLRRQLSRRDATTESV
jgi:hypothetical protein